VPVDPFIRLFVLDVIMTVLSPDDSEAHFVPSKIFEVAEARINREKAMAIMTVQNLKKRYGDIEAVKNISFEIEEGEIFGIVGPKGAQEDNAHE
jgi:ABC-type glutathione transport system ATPase component